MPIKMQGAYKILNRARKKVPKSCNNQNTKCEKQRKDIEYSKREILNHMKADPSE